MRRAISDDAAAEAYRIEWSDKSSALHKVPDYMRPAFYRWVVWGIEGGDFFMSLVSNDLMGAFRAADDANRDAMRHWVQLFYNGAPAACFGSDPLAQRWMKKGGLLGRCADCDSGFNVPGDKDSIKIDVEGGAICERCAEKRADMKHAAQIMGG